MTLVVERRSPAVRAEPVARAAVLVGLVASAVHGVLAGRALYADGANLAYMIAQQDGLWISDRNRSLAAVVMQSPAVVATMLGVKDIGVIVPALAAGLIGSVAVGWFLALVLQWRTQLFWVFAVAWAVADLGSAMIPVGEFRLSYALAALGASLLLRPTRLRPWSGVLLLMTAVVLTRTYESSAYLGLVLFAIAAARLLRTRPGPAEQLVLLSSMALFAMSSGLGIWGILFPRDPGNAQSAAHLLGPLRQDHQLLIGGLVVVGVLALTWWRQGRGRAVLLWGTTALSAFLVVPAVWARPELHYLTRTAAGLVLAVLLVVAATIRYLPSSSPQVPGEAAHLVWVPAVVAVLASLLALTVHTEGFRAWVGRVECVVVDADGPVPLLDAGLDPHATALYGWSWTNPLLSALFQDDSRGVLLNPGAGDQVQPAPSLPAGWDAHGLLVAGSCG